MFKATFHTRLRVLNHVRSSACRTEVVDLPELPEETIVRCRKADAAEIRAARQDGRSAPAARTSATSHDGKTRPGGIARLSQVVHCRIHVFFDLVAVFGFPTF